MEDTLRVLQSQIRSAVASSAAIACTDEVGDIQELLRRTRAERGMSLEDVAAAAGMSKSHIWEMEKGRQRNFTVDCMDRLSRALGIPFLTMCAAALHTIREQKDASP